MIENLGFDMKKSAKPKVLENFSKHRVMALSTVSVTPERLEVKMWALRSFVDLRLAVLIHSKKLQIRV